MRIEKFLDELATSTLSALTGESAPALLRPTADAKHGDYQINAAMALAKRLGKKPREIAEPLAAKLAEHEAIEKAEVAGPGFVNLTLAPAFLARALEEAAADFARDGVPSVERPLRVIVDFSSPNIAKQMHVGHLRSTIIGDALRNLLRLVGHEVTGVNHIGDWGTQYGLLLTGMRQLGDTSALESSPIEELERVYRESSARAKEDEGFAQSARDELAKLQNGDPENLDLWKKFVETTRVELDRVYDRMGIEFDSWRGESSYNEALAGVVDSLKEAGLARLDDGAMGVFWGEIEGAPEKLKKQKEPFLVRKRDGAFLYATTDVAAALYRKRELGADRIYYVVDARQAGHFEQLFALVRLLGVELVMEHVSFGTVLDESGKPLKTRDGKAVTLASLLDEAEERARARIAEGVSEGKLHVAAEDMPQVARALGIGAVKYADLRQNRTSDYQFDWDKMLSFQGNAGPYLQYAYARIASLFDKADKKSGAQRAAMTLEAPEEIRLGKVLVRFGEVVHQAAETAQPHLLTDHLYELARAFSGFYEACPILKAEGATTESRLTLAAMTSRQLGRGLGLLGIQVVERM